jgi:hypothetical protein
MEWQIVAGRELADEFLVAIRLFATKAMVQVNGGEHQPQLIAQVIEDSEQCDRVCAPRNGHPDAVSGNKKGVPLNVAGHRSREQMHRVMVHR